MQTIDSIVGEAGVANGTLASRRLARQSLP